MGKKVFLLLMFCIFFGPRALMAQTPIPKITGNAVINEDVIITLAGDDPVPMAGAITCLFYTTPSARDVAEARMPSSALKKKIDRNKNLIPREI